MVPRFEGLFSRWLLATAAGWVLGIVLVVILAEIWSVTGMESQFMVGIGMGAGVGYMQSRIVTTVIGASRRWLWSSVVGLGVPFIAWDLGAFIDIDVPFALQVFVLLGALFAGLLQTVMLRRHSVRAPWWVPACVVGWGLPAALAALKNAGVVPLIAILIGGVILGAVTGIALSWISKGHPPQAAR